MTITTSSTLHCNLKKREFTTALLHCKSNKNW